MYVLSDQQFERPSSWGQFASADVCRRATRSEELSFLRQQRSMVFPWIRYSPRGPRYMQPEWLCPKALQKRVELGGVYIL